MKKLLIIICLLLLVITSIGGYFAYVDYTTRQKKKEAKRLLYAMQEEIKQTTYIAKSKNDAKIAMKKGYLRRENALDAVYELREYAFDVYSKDPDNQLTVAGEKIPVRLGNCGIDLVITLMNKIDQKYKISDYATVDKKNSKLIFPESKFKQFIEVLCQEKISEGNAAIQEAKFNIAELKKENVSHAKIIEIKDRYKKLIQKLETE